MNELAESPESLPRLCVVIGASTGGPPTLVEVLRQIPDVKDSCVMILQHLDASLSGNLATWLSFQTGLQVMRVENRYRPQSGDIVLMTGAHWHMNAAQTVKACEQDMAGVYVKPSIDRMMLSMVKYWQHDAEGVLLTGMGKDGAQGLLAMRKKGWETYAQQEQDCVLYGMPKEAARINAAHVIQSPQHIGISLNQSMQYDALTHKEK